MPARLPSRSERYAFRIPAVGTKLEGM